MLAAGKSAISAVIAAVSQAAACVTIPWAPSNRPENPRRDGLKPRRDSMPSETPETPIRQEGVEMADGCWRDRNSEGFVLTVGAGIGYGLSVEPGVLRTWQRMKRTGEQVGNRGPDGRPDPSRKVGGSGYRARGDRKRPSQGEYARIVGFGTIVPGGALPAHHAIMGRARSWKSPHPWWRLSRLANLRGMLRTQAGRDGHDRRSGTSGDRRDRMLISAACRSKTAPQRRERRIARYQAGITD